VVGGEHIHEHEVLAEAHGLDVVARLHDDGRVGGGAVDRVLDVLVGTRGAADIGAVLDARVADVDCGVRGSERLVVAGRELALVGGRRWLDGTRRGMVVLAELMRVLHAQLQELRVVVEMGAGMDTRRRW